MLVTSYYECGDQKQTDVLIEKVRKQFNFYFTLISNSQMLTKKSVNAALSRQSPCMRNVGFSGAKN